MKHRNIYLGIIVLTTLIFISCSAGDDFPELKGPYLGQKPPGMTPKIFAPGIISTGYSERIAAFSPDGNEFYYVIWGAPHGVILQMKQKNGIWTKPRVATFSGRYQGDFTMSGDGNIIVFSSNSPLDGVGAPLDVYYSWIVESKGNDWGKPKPFGPLINLRESYSCCPTIANNRNLYFFSGRSGGMGKDDIWMAEFSNGKYLKPVNLGSSVNGELTDLDPFIAPDESYIIFCKIVELRKYDLFISFRREDGSWTKAKTMGDKINSSSYELCPTVSPDGKYFFFTSTRRVHKQYSEIPISYNKKIEILNKPGNGNGDIYWVDANIIEELKPEELK